VDEDGRVIGVTSYERLKVAIHAAEAAEYPEPERSPAGIAVGDTAAADGAADPGRNGTSR
jgi:hypothetical protein